MTDIINKMIGKYNFFRSKWYFYQGKKALDIKLSTACVEKRIYFFCTPTHSNLGDQAQLMCWLRLFSEWYPDYKVIQVSTRFRVFDTLRNIHKIIKPEDKIFIHSGYLIFDPHPELPFILDVVRDFYDHPITILPQTVNLMGEWYQHIVSGIFNANPNLTLMCRDEVSLKKAKLLFPNIKLILMPDVVTSLIGNSYFQYPNSKRNGVMLCVRNDLEKFYSSEQIQTLRERFNCNTSITDTTINVQPWVWGKNREKLIRSILEEFSKYQVIITDRYHGTIFSQIVNTPVVVLSSADHKLSSGVKWFPKDNFGHNMYYAHDLDEAYNLAKNILDRNGKVFKNPPYFKDEYYSEPYD